MSEEGADDMEKRDVRERRAKYEGTGQNIDEFGVPKWLVGCDVGVCQVTPPKNYFRRRAVSVCEWVSLPLRRSDGVGFFSAEPKPLIGQQKKKVRWWLLLQLEGQLRMCSNKNRLPGH